MHPIIAIVLIILALAAGAAAGFLYRQNVMEKKIGRTEEYANNLLTEATHKAEEKKKEAILEAKEEVIRLRSELDKEVRDRRSEVTQAGAPRVTSARKRSIRRLDNLEAREENAERKI